MSTHVSWILLAALAGQAEPESGVELDPAQFGLDAVVDKSEIRFEDRDAYFGILKHLQDVDPQELREAAADHRRRRWSSVDDYGEFAEHEFPVFVDLFMHPDVYRGQPVTLRGHLVGPVIVLPTEAGSGVDRLYQAHLYDNDAQTNPTTVVFTELPPGVDLESEMIDGVTVTGYFLKIHWYRSRAGQRQLAPLVLARTFEVRTPAPPEWPVARQVIIALIVIVAVLALLIVLIISRRDRGAIRAYRRRFQTKPEFDASEFEISEH